MNLTAIFKKDAALIDHSWVETGLSREEGLFDDLSGIKKNNNTKPDLELEWGLASGPDFDIDAPAGVVQRNLPDTGVEQNNNVIIFARDMMNRGATQTRVVAALKSKFASTDLKAALPALSNLFKLDGIIGRVAVDGRGYANCQEALKAASQSPYKRFIKYVIGCNCGTPHMIPARDEGMVLSASSGNGIDDILASKEDHVAKMVSHCCNTMIPILSAQGDLDKSDLDTTLIELENTTGLPSGITKEIRESKVSNLCKAKMAFNKLDELQATAAVKPVQKASSKEWTLKQADEEIPLAVEMADLDFTYPKGDMEAEVLGEVAPDLAFPLVTKDQEIDLSNEVAPDLAFPLVTKDQEIDLSNEQPEAVDVDMGICLDPIFEGTDEIVLEDETVPPEDMSVDLRQDGRI